MVRGTNDKHTGYWMYLEQIVRPQLQNELQRRVNCIELKEFGSSYWNALRIEERQEWKEKAKAINLHNRGHSPEMCRRDYEKTHRHKKKSTVHSLIAPKLKPSNIMPPSGRYDEVDEYSRKYFAAVDDDFEGMRNHHLRGFIDHYQWKFAQKETSEIEEFFCDSEMMIATAKLYCEDTLAERMVPSEISILKISINRGIFDQLHYILGFAEHGTLGENCDLDIIENERLTGLRRDASMMNAEVRYDYEEVWEEIKNFTGIAGDRVKLLVLSDEWNTVVGSFDTIFSHTTERSFSRIETRFATIEDYFMAIYATTQDVRIDDDIRLSVATEMRERWPGAVVFDSVTCDFHYKMRYEQQCQARNCSLFNAHEAAFNFFTLCKKFVFKTFNFTGKHMPNKAFLSTADWNFLECKSRRNRVCSLSKPARNVPVKVPGRMSRDSFAPVSSQKKLINVDLNKSSSLTSGQSITSHSLGRGMDTAYIIPADECDQLKGMVNQTETCYDVEKWLQEIREVPQEDDSNFDSLPVVSDFAVASENNVRSSPTNPTIHKQSHSFNQPLQKFLQNPYQKLKADHHLQSVDARFISPVINAEWKTYNQQGQKQHPATLEADDDSDNEMFSNISIPVREKCLQTAASQTSVSRKPVDERGDANLKMSMKRIKNDLDQSSVTNMTKMNPCSIQNGVANFNAVHNKVLFGFQSVLSAPTKSTLTGRTESLMPLSSVKPNHFLVQSIVQRSKLNGFSSKIAKDLVGDSLPSTSKSLDPFIDLTMKQTLGGFSVPNDIGKRNHRTRGNQFSSVVPKIMPTKERILFPNSTSNRSFGKLTVLQTDKGVTNGTSPSSASLNSEAAVHAEPGMTSAITNGVPQISLSNLAEQCDDNNAAIDDRKNQAMNSIKLILKPVVYKEAEEYGWSENMKSNAGWQFVEWLKSASFE